MGGSARGNMGMGSNQGAILGGPGGVPRQGAQPGMDWRGAIDQQRGALNQQVAAQSGAQPQRMDTRWQQPQQQMQDPRAGMQQVQQAAMPQRMQLPWQPPQQGGGPILGGPGGVPTINPGVPAGLDDPQSALRRRKVLMDQPQFPVGAALGSPPKLY